MTESVCNTPFSFANILNVDFEQMKEEFRCAAVY